MDRLLEKIGLRNLFVLLGVAAPILGYAVYEDGKHAPAAAGISCGLAIFGGLCMIAAALVEAAERKHRQGRSAQDREGER